MVTDEAQAEQEQTDAEWLVGCLAECLGGVVIGLVSVTSSHSLLAAARAVPPWAQVLVLAVAFGALSLRARLRRARHGLRVWLRPALWIVYVSAFVAFLLMLRAAYPSQYYWGFLLLLIAVGLVFAGVRAWRRRHRAPVQVAPWDR
jgi:ABC-type xylose transport system permease subunit